MLEKRNGKWVTVSSSGDVFNAKGRYIFVQQNGNITVGRMGVVYDSRIRAGHIDLSGGAPVDYAGEVQFSGTTNPGRLRYWTNGSGHYRPPEALRPIVSAFSEYEFRPYTTEKPN